MNKAITVTVGEKKKKDKPSPSVKVKNTWYTKSSGSNHKSRDCMYIHLGE